MNPVLALFCLEAAERGILTHEHGQLLLEICTPDSTLAEFVDLVVSLGVAEDGKKVVALMNDGDWPEAPDTEEEPIPDADAPTDDFVKVQDSISPELEWFCFFGVCEGVLDAATCRGIVSLVSEAGEVLPFAQAMVDMGICDDPVKIQEMKDRAAVEAAKEPQPPFSIFEE